MGTFLGAGVESSHSFSKSPLLVFGSHFASLVVVTAFSRAHISDLCRCLTRPAGASPNLCCTNWYSLHHETAGLVWYMLRLVASQVSPPPSALPMSHSFMRVA